MVRLALEEPVSWILIIAIFGVIVVMLYLILFPKATDLFFDKIKFDFLDIHIGKEKLKSEFEITKEMEENVETIYEALSSDNLEKEKITKLELKEFDDYQLTIARDPKGNLEIIIKNIKGQTEVYNKDLERYRPCIVNLRNTPKPPFQVEFVTNIIFTDETIFNIGNENIKYILAGLIKTENNICFAGNIITLPGYLPEGVST